MGVEESMADVVGLSEYDGRLELSFDGTVRGRLTILLTNL